MRMGLRGIWVIILVLTFFVGAITTGIVVFADEAPKTLAEECAEELEDDDMDLEGLFCLALQSLNAQFDGIFVQTDPNKPVLFLKVDPNSQAPALVVNDGTNDLFIVNNDGSIQIGSNTVVLNPDGTVTGGPLLLEVGSKVDGKLIVAPSKANQVTCDNKQLAQFIGNSWRCTNPEDIGAGGLTLGAEVIVLNNNFDDLSGGRTISSDFAGAEFTMPTTASLWKFTAIEVKTGNTVNTRTIACGVIVGLNEAFPFSADNRVIATKIGLTQDTDDVLIPTNTIIKMPIKDSIFVNGGDEFIVIAGGCNNFSSKFAGQTRTNTWSTLSMNSLLVNGDDDINVIVVKAPAFEHYIVVYAVPYN